MQLAHHIHTHAPLMRGLDWANTTATIVLGLDSQNFLSSARDNDNEVECSSIGNVAIYDKQFLYDKFHITSKKYYPGSKIIHFHNLNYSILSNEEKSTIVLDI